MKKATAFLFLFFALVIWWFGLRSEYKFTTYSIVGCNQPVTLVEYWRPFQHGAAFVRGNYHTREIPNRDCVIIADLNGFDAYFEVVVTCEKGTLIVNYNDYLPPSALPAEGILAQELDDGAFHQLRQDRRNRLIKLH